MSVQWIEYKNKPILYADIRKLRGDELMQDLDILFNIIGECPNDMVILVNEEGAYISQEYQERWKYLTEQARLESAAKGHFKVKKVTIVGLDPVKSLLLSGYMRATGQNIKPFKTEEEAKEWLIQE